MITRAELKHIFDSNRNQDPNAGFTRAQEKEIKRLVELISDLFTGLHTFVHSGGGYYHLALQTIDMHWLTFHSESEDVTLSLDGFETTDDFMESVWIRKDQHWGELLFEAGDYDYWEEKIHGLIKV
jgi:hypothetical protein